MATENEPAERTVRCPRCTRIGAFRTRQPAPGYCAQCWLGEQVKVELVEVGDVDGLSAEVERLRSVLRQTHESHCTESWTSRGLHAPECLLSEVVP